ncbi:uncharacterized protein LOC112577450 [Pomacea canaliculata]|uniref:uncharacterized protein LOC112577450 n=1 Tax=Pomacea canaliculata TaxID=400727 RepID=UPI000D736F2D|nr:uncharacterized protein LOC112577450 [Pomacea canaliculata]
MRALSLHVPLLSLWAPLLLLPVSKARRTVEVLCGDFSTISLANDVSKNDMDRVHVLLSHPGMNGATLDLVKGLQYQLTVSSGEVDRIRGLALIVTSDGEAPSPTDLQSPPSPQHPCGLVVTSTARASVDVTPTSSWLLFTSPVPVSQHSPSSTEVLPGVLSSITPTSSAFVQPFAFALVFALVQTVQPSWPSLGNTLSTAVESITPYSDTSLLLPVSLKWTADVTTSSTCITVTIVIMINDSAWTQTTRELCKPTGCKEYFTEESGLIASPNFPSQYPDGSRCTYIISPSSSRFIELQFQSFQLEQPYSGKCMDWLTVSNSTSPTERLCGTADVNQLRHMDYVTTGNVLIIQFVTDSKISGNGFQAVYATDIAKSKT